MIRALLRRWRAMRARHHDRVAQAAAAAALHAYGRRDFDAATRHMCVANHARNRRDVLIDRVRESYPQPTGWSARPLPTGDFRVGRR